MRAASGCAEAGGVKSDASPDDRRLVAPPAVDRNFLGMVDQTDTPAQQASAKSSFHVVVVP
jgi:hypothetical protein